MIYGYFNLESNTFHIIRILMPVLILNIIVFLRYLLISADYSFFWLILSALVLIQQILLIIKLDYATEILWKWILIPTILLICSIFFMSLYLIWEKFLEFSGVFFSITNTIGSLLCLVGFSYGVFIDITNTTYFLCVIGLLIHSLACIESFGSFVMDITIGHIDVDVLDLKYPIQTLSNAPHSV